MRQEMRLIFGEGIEELVLPLFEEIRGEIDTIKEKLEEHDRRFDNVENHLVKLDRKFDVAMERMDEHSLILKDHDSCLTNLENPPDPT